MSVLPVENSASRREAGRVSVARGDLLRFEVARGLGRMLALVAGDGLGDFLRGEVGVMVGLQDVIAIDGRRRRGFGWVCDLIIHIPSLKFCGSLRRRADSRRLPGDGAIICGSHCCR